MLSNKFLLNMICRIMHIINIINTLVQMIKNEIILFILLYKLIFQSIYNYFNHNTAYFVYNFYIKKNLIKKNGKLKDKKFYYFI